jgi:hypothetical protein
MVSGAKIYVPSFMKIGWGIQKLLDTQTADLVSLLLFFSK